MEGLIYATYFIQGEAGESEDVPNAFTVSVILLISQENHTH